MDTTLRWIPEWLTHLQQRPLDSVIRFFPQRSRDGAKRTNLLVTFDRMSRIGILLNSKSNNDKSQLYNTV